MAAFSNQSGASSTVPSISDLDGFTVRDYNFPSGSYTSGHDDDFGFDPPHLKAESINKHEVYSPPDNDTWPDFTRDEDSKSAINLDSYEIDKFITATLPNISTAVSRYGQMTPPRSTSVNSSDSKIEASLSPKRAAPEHRENAKSQTKVAEPATTTTTTMTTSGRKRKTTRKVSTLSSQGDSLEDQKRKQSLEKNRLAAAKCRVNKKEKTDQLQRDSHDKAVQNAMLKDQIIRMKDEIQQMNSFLLAHANCEGCKSPEEIQGHLNDLGNEFFNQPMAPYGQHYGEYSQMNFQELTAIPDGYFARAPQNSLLHPPLPDFDRSAEFEVHTPMQTD